MCFVCVCVCVYVFDIEANINNIQQECIILFYGFTIYLTNSEFDFICCNPSFVF